MERLILHRRHTVANVGRNISFFKAARRDHNLRARAREGPGQPASWPKNRLMSGLIDLRWAMPLSEHVLRFRLLRLRGSGGEAHVEATLRIRLHLTLKSPSGPVSMRRALLGRMSSSIA
jgi:hypothetical protein